MILHRHYRTTLSQIDAISTLIDACRTHCPESRKITQAIKRLEERLEILRRRRDHNQHKRRQKAKLEEWIRSKPEPLSEDAKQAFYRATSK